MHNDISQEIKQFGNLIRRLMAADNRTKKEVAYEADISVNTLNNLADGQNVGFKTILSILYALNISLADAIVEIELQGLKLTSFSKIDNSIIDTEVVKTEIDAGVSPEQIAMRLGVKPREVKQVASAIA
jgi:transcriptional regulator with XRE-family HTH domain